MHRFTNKNDPFSTFINFIVCDATWRATQKELDAQEHQRMLLAQEREDKAAGLSAFKETVHVLFKRMQAYELEARVCRDRIAQVKKKLEYIESPREYTALHKELEELTSKEKNTEELLFATWQEHELQQAEYEQKQKEHLLWLKDHEAAGKLAEEAHQALAEKLKTIERERAQLEQEVAPDFLSTYYTMKQLVVDPVVPVIDNCCSACRCLAAQQDLALMRRHVLVKCKECYRLLYGCLS